MNMFFFIGVLILACVQTFDAGTNVLDGPNNVVYYGVDNSVHGRDNEIAGYANNINGNTNAVWGDHNDLNGGLN